MSRTLQTLLDERASALIGRDRERELLLDPGAPIVFVHGIAGVGKTALLRAFASDARARGADVLVLDCRKIEPTERGFRAALGGASPDVLVLDAYERLKLLDAWLRTEFVPALPEATRIVLAARDAPVAWQRSFGELVKAVRLGNLAPDDARRVLLATGLSERAAEYVNRLARGHPLALQLASAPGAGVEPAVEELARVYLDGLDPPTRAALDAAAVVRRTTRSLLAAMLPDAPVQDAFERLRALPFVECDREGLFVHDTVREVAAALRSATDPVGHRQARIAAWRRLRAELREAGSGELWRYTADMIYLVEHPAVREAFFPSGTDEHVVEPADAFAPIEALAPERELPLLRAWWDYAPQAFRVVRDGSGRVGAYVAIAERQDVPARLFELDPVLRAWRAHLRRAPVPPGARVLLSRHHLERRTPASPALMLDIKRRYLELRPRLRRVYLAAPAPGPLAPLGFQRLDLEVPTVMLDFGPASVDGWLSAVVGSELEGDDVLDRARRQLVLDGERVDLTRLELEVLTYLREREGAAVEREGLLRDVWGYEWTGGSNVIEVVISALRKKLGARAGALETVRGVGYRLGSLS
jgi:hypothetical protein